MFAIACFRTPLEGESVPPVQTYPSSLFCYRYCLTCSFALDVGLPCITREEESEFAVEAVAFVCYPEETTEAFAFLAY